MKQLNVTKEDLQLGVIDFIPKKKSLLITPELEEIKQTLSNMALSLGWVVQKLNLLLKKESV